MAVMYKEDGYPMQEYPDHDQSGSGHPGATNSLNYIYKNGNAKSAPMHKKQKKKEYNHKDFVLTRTKPKDYMCLSVASLFCFWPFAIGAIGCSCKSKSDAKKYKFKKAQKNGICARNTAMIAVVIGLFLYAAAIIAFSIFYIPLLIAIYE